MALDPQQRAQFKKDLEEINRLRKSINEKPIALEVSSENLEALPGLLRDAKEAAYELEDSVEGIRGRWQGIVGEIQKANLNVKETTKSFNKFNDMAQKLQYHQRGSNELSSKELKSLITRQKIEQENLRYQQAALSTKVKSGTATEEELDTLKEINAQLAKENGLVDTTLKKTQELYKQQKNIEKATGLTGVAMKGIASLTNKIGMGDMGNVFEDAAEAAKATASRLTDGGKKAGGFITKVKAMGSAFKVVGKAIVENLTDPLVLAGMLIKGLRSAYNFFASAYKEGKEAAMVISDESTNMARSLGLAQNAASKLAGSVAGLGPTVAMSKQSVVSLYEAMGSTEKLSSETLRVFVKLNTQAGMSADSLVKFQKFAKLAGEDAGVMVKNMTNTALQAIKTNNLAISQKELLTESANQSAYIRVQFAKQPQELIKAVAASKQLGINMEKTRDISRSLLNFEDSIAAEMEAELLTGKDLNFERARQLALQGDSLGAAKEVLAQMGGIEEFNKLNVIQQEAMAAAAGMTVDQLTEQMDAAAGMKKENGDLVDEQQDGLKAMTSEVSKREQEENRARKAAESNIAVYKELQPLIDSLRDTWIEIKQIIMETLGKEVLKPMMDFFKSDEGKNFLKELPGRVKAFAEGVKDVITTIKDFIKEHPKISMAILGGVVAAKPIASALGGLMSGDVKGAAMDAMGVERGTAANPMVVRDVNGGVSDAIDLIGKNGRASFMKQVKTLFKKPQVMFRAMAMKGRGLTRIVGRIGTKFSGLIKSLGTFGSSIKSAIKGMGSFIKSLGSNIAKGAKSLWSSIKSGASKLVGGVKNVASKAWSGAKSLGSKALGGVKSMAGKAWSGVKGAGSAVWKGMKSVGGAAIKGLKTAGNFVMDKAIIPAKKWIGGKIGGFLPKMLRGAKGPLKGALKRIPFVGAVIEAIDAGMDINELAKSQKMSKSEIYSKMGKRIIGGGLGVILGSIAATLVSSLQAIGIPGWLLSTIAFAGGDWLGKTIGNAISDYVGGPKLGKAVFDTFYSGKGNASTKKADDMFSGYGNRVLLHPEGAIALNNKDTVIAGTNLFRGDDVVSGPAGSMVSSAAVLEKLDQLIRVIEKGGTVVLDGQKVGEALVAGSYRMQ